LLREGSAGRASYQGAAISKSPFFFLDGGCKWPLLVIFHQMRDLGRILVIFGGVITIVGLVLWAGFGGSWLGRLPGDIRIERGNTSFYFPIVTCIIVSAVLTLLLSLFRR
jgi:hypothetical protein